MVQRTDRENGLSGHDGSSGNRRSDETFLFAVAEAERLGHSMKPEKPWIEAPRVGMRATNCSKCLGALIVDGDRYYGDVVEESCESRLAKGAP